MKYLTISKKRFDNICISENGRIIANSKMVAEQFNNNYLVTVAQTLVE